MRSATAIIIVVIAATSFGGVLWITENRPAVLKSENSAHFQSSTERNSETNATVSANTAAPRASTSLDVRPNDAARYDRAAHSTQQTLIQNEIDNLLEWAKVLGSAVHCGVIDDVSASALLGNREGALQDEFGPAAWIEKFVRNDEKPGISPGGQVVNNYRNAVSSTMDCSGWRTNTQLVYQLRREATLALTSP